MMIPRLMMMVQGSGPFAGQHALHILAVNRREEQLATAIRGPPPPPGYRRRRGRNIRTGETYDVYVRDLSDQEVQAEEEAVQAAMAAAQEEAREICEQKDPPIRADGLPDWGARKRAEMVRDHGSYPTRIIQDGPGVRKYWRHDVSGNWMYWSKQAEPHPQWAQYRPELDTSLLEEHACAGCGDWFDCAGTHKMIPNCACWQLWHPGKWHYYCSRGCHPNTE